MLCLLQIEIFGLFSRATSYAETTMSARYYFIAKSFRDEFSRFYGFSKAMEYLTARNVCTREASRCIYEVRRNGLSGRPDIIIVDRGNRDFSTRACI